MSCLLPDRRLLTALFSGLMILCGPLSGPQISAQTPTAFEHGVVAADHEAASEAGAEMLRRGGNVVDAAVATSFALSVVRPASCGVGGGGFMVIWNAERQQAVAIDYRERAPAASTRDMFAAAGPGDDRESGSVRGGRACGIPGTVAGLCLAAREYGTLPLSTLLEPAIRLAEQGVAIDQHDISVQASTLAKLRRYPDYEQKFAALKKHYLNDGVTWQTGDRFHSPQLPLLKKLAAEGERAFYEGEVAVAIVSASREQGGVLTLEDLASTTVPVIRQPLTGEFHGYRLLAMPPASSGGVALLQTLNTLQHWERRSGRTLKSLGHNTADYVHVVTEAMKHAFADRAEYLGDADFVDVPIKRLMSQDYAAEIASRISISQLFMIDSHQMQDGRMQVVHVNFVFDRFESEIIRGAVDSSPFNSTTCQPHRETEGIVIPSISSLSCRSSTEFPSPDDQGFLKQSAVFEIGYELSDRPVYVFTQFFILRSMFTVRVPGLSIPIVHLHKTDTFLAEPTCHQAGLGKGTGTVSFLNMFWLFADIK